MIQAQAAELLVVERLGATLSPDYRLFSDGAWLGRTAERRGPREGEAALSGER